jgi:MFS family permease
MALNSTLLQTLVPDEFRGRVMSVYMLTWGLMPLGTLPSGLIAEHFGAPLAIGVGGAISALVVVVVALRRPVLREMA